MANDEEYITELMNLSRDNCEDIEILNEIDEILQQNYGISYEQYASIRNNLLIQYNYMLPSSVLEEFII